MPASPPQPGEFGLSQSIGLSPWAKQPEPAAAPGRSQGRARRTDPSPVDEHGRWASLLPPRHRAHSLPHPTGLCFTRGSCRPGPSTAASSPPGTGSCARRRPAAIPSWTSLAATPSRRPRTRSGSGRRCDRSPREGAASSWTPPPPSRASAPPMPAVVGERPLRRSYLKPKKPMEQPPLPSFRPDMGKETELRRELRATAASSKCPLPIVRPFLCRSVSTPGTGTDARAPWCRRTRARRHPSRQSRTSAPLPRSFPAEAGSGWSVPRCDGRCRSSATAILTPPRPRRPATAASLLPNSLRLASAPW